MNFKSIEQKMSQFKIKSYVQKAHDEKEIEEIEKSLSINLSDDYKEFLLKYGECMIMEDNLVFPVLEDTPLSDEGVLPLGFFYGLEDNRYDIRNVRDIYFDQMPEWVLPIADAEGGDQICIGVKGEKKGKIYFWDHELRDRQQDLFLVANTFSDFIQSLFVKDTPKKNKNDGVISIELDEDLLND
ncbi:SMI1/KNR4 family protein [Bacillus sp. z60-18]|uniref:SMI1/KNR4 family protein n=1 Tax=unclassified Bacillus (in: firmicutes) TaxID=185979 RepID=UPI00390C8755